MNKRKNVFLPIVCFTFLFTNVGVLVAATPVDPAELNALGAGTAMTDSLDAAEPSVENITTNALTASTAASVAASVDRERGIVELLPEDFKPAFTRDTVIKLNAIVQRSYAAIEGYDSIQSDLNSEAAVIRSNTDSARLLSNNQLVAMDIIEGYSKSALSDMKDAVLVLEASDEYYNRAVLAGMMMFVASVEKEVGVFAEEIDAVGVFAEEIDAVGVSY